MNDAAGDSVSFRQLAALSWICVAQLMYTKAHWLNSMELDACLTMLENSVLSFMLCAGHLMNSSWLGAPPTV